MPPDRKSKARRFLIRVSNRGDQKLDKPDAGSIVASISPIS
jgi:hypothetical protein